MPRQVEELHAAEFYSEDNGYETIRHSSGSGDKDINLNHYPSQMSTCAGPLGAASVKRPWCSPP